MQIALPSTTKTVSCVGHLARDHNTYLGPKLHQYGLLWAVWIPRAIDSISGLLIRTYIMTMVLVVNGRHSTPHPRPVFLLACGLPSVDPR